MDNFIDLELFKLLSASSQITDEQMKNAYERFTEEIKILHQSETDYQTIYRRLSLTRIEFISLQSLLRYEQGEKCP